MGGNFTEIQQEFLTAKLGFLGIVVFFGGGELGVLGRGGERRGE